MLEAEVAAFCGRCLVELEPVSAHKPVWRCPSCGIAAIAHLPTA